MDQQRKIQAIAIAASEFGSGASDCKFISEFAALDAVSATA
jgi:hypothetical protein